MATSENDLAFDGGWEYAPAPESTDHVRIDKRYEFPKDSSVSILTSGLLGDQFIGIDGGGDIDLLEDGDRVRLTQSAIVLEKVIGQFLYGKAAEGGSSD